jgi:hypothetical protein
VVEGARVEARRSRRTVRAFDLPGGRLADAEDFSFDYLGNVSSIDDVRSANNHRVNSEFDLWLSRRLYFVSTLSLERTKRFDLDVSFVWSGIV